MAPPQSATAPPPSATQSDAAALQLFAMAGWQETEAGAHQAFAEAHQTTEGACTAPPAQAAIVNAVPARGEASRDRQRKPPPGGKSQKPKVSSLPPPWQEFTHNDGRKYYYNPETQVTLTLIPPLPLIPPLTPPLTPAPTPPLAQPLTPTPTLTPTLTLAGDELEAAAQAAAAWQLPTALLRVRRDGHAQVALRPDAVQRVRPQAQDPAGEGVGAAAAGRRHGGRPQAGPPAEG